MNYYHFLTIYLLYIKLNKISLFVLIYTNVSKLILNEPRRKSLFIDPHLQSFKRLKYPYDYVIPFLL